jgi:hypothetical protein
MSSDRFRLLVFGAIVLLAGASLAWLQFGAIQPSRPPQPAPPILYADYDVTLNGPWVFIRNTGTETLATVQIRFEADIAGSSTAWYGGDRTFRDREWGPGDVLKVGVPCEGGRVRAFRFTGGARSASFDRLFRLRHGELTGGPKIETEGVGFDPDLAAAMDAEKAEATDRPPTAKK